MIVRERSAPAADMSALSVCVEQMCMTAERPAGFSHYGLHVENAAQAVASFRKRGLTVTDTNASDTKAILANITDPYMGRIELTELPPESMHYKAIQNWK